MPATANKKIRFSKTRRNQKPKFSLLRLVKIFLWLGIIVGFSYYFFFDKKLEEGKKEVAAAEVQVQAEKVDEPEEKESAMQSVPLAESINKVLKSYPGINSSVVVSEVGGENQVFGSENTFTGASTTKVMAAICLLQKVEEGKTTLNSGLGGSTVDWQIKQMINQSNNDSWNAITNYLGYSKYQACAKNLGATSFNPYNNTVAAKDLATVLKGLYSRKFLNEENTKLLLSYMQNTNNENLIPAALNNEIVYHKYGNYEKNLHDAAIIFNGSKTYVLVVMTSTVGSSNYPAQTELIHEATKAVVDFYR